MQDKIWYLYQNGKQEGPYPVEFLVELHHKTMLSQSCYLFKTGWKEWRPIEDCLSELGPKENLISIPPPPPVLLEKRRREAPRATVAGEIIVHNDKDLLKGTAANISATGLFVSTKEEIFKIGEKIKITCKIKELPEPFKAQATVIRYSKDREDHTGYGLVFEGLNPQIKHKIEELIQFINRKKAAS
ncbi:MAG: PilZ domain-containing protein [Oligoflexales bacterium]|nr:PilZ domain-containing protein [Oligoflexales bacterium]